MSKFVISPEARKDVRDIWAYIARNSDQAANNFRDRIFDTFRKLAGMPGMGRYWKGLQTKRFVFGLWAITSSFTEPRRGPFR